MKAINSALAFAVAVLMMSTLAMSGAASGADVKGGKDHPLVSRYEGGRIVKYAQVKFDEYTLLLGKAKARKPGEHLTVEGAVTQIRYEIHKERTTLEIFRNYRQALADAGFETLFACKNKECGGRDFGLVVIPYDGVMSDNYNDQRFLAAKLTRPEGTAYVSLYIVKAYNIGGAKKNNVYVQLDIVETAEMETGMVTVDAEAMGKGLDAEGHIAIYGIYFDSGSDKVKPASDEALGEIAKLMEARPDLELLVVGHTDNQGDLDYNMDLSKRRATAVVKALTKGHGIGADRLMPAGVAFLAPVASNRGDGGRSQNRRVELVER
jgi:outer membrane protein OmpA-like peptidoglycan-associated protein